MKNSSGVVLVISGPSGAGKSSLINKIKDEIGEHYFSISTTTRAIRPGEQEGVHYHFVNEDEFKREIEADNFLEYALVHGNYYGTSLKAVREALHAGKLVIFDIDVQGNAIVKNRLGDVLTSVFVTTPSLSILEKRLRARDTDSEEVIQKRIKMARREVQRISEYDYLIVNDDLEEAAKKLKKIVEFAKLKQSDNEINEFVQKWEDS